MAGHSQFKNIMYRKGSQDAKRSKAFAKLAREISVAVKNGSDDPKQNPRLRNAIINARSENMPNERIAKAIQKAIGSDDDKNYEESWDRTFDVLLKGQVTLIRAALPFIRESDCGRIVNISSTEGIGATPRISPYTSAKHGVIGLTRSLAAELGSEGITVNCICPGPINTAMTAAIPAEDKKIYARRRVPLKRYGEPEEVAHMTLSLCLPAASFVNGAVLTVDGGLSIKRA